jgi:hypothetical protein
MDTHESSHRYPTRSRVPAVRDGDLPVSEQQKIFTRSQTKAASELEPDLRVNTDEAVFNLLSSTPSFGINSSMSESLEYSYGVWKETAKDLGETWEEVLSSKETRTLEAIHKDVDPKINIPKNAKEAMASKEHKIWRFAMEREISALVSNNTWVLHKKTSGQRLPLSGRWIFSIKYRDDNSVSYCKARWVIHGFREIQGLDYQETFAATAQMRTFRLLISISAAFGLQCFHADISNAFTNGILKETIFMVYHKGFEGPDGHCLRLLKSLYGLKQASRVWFQTLLAALLKIGFIQCVADTCLFFHKTSVCYISIHVDDLLIATKNLSFKNKILKMLREIFKLTDLGLVKMYLGMNVTFTKDFIKVSQESYIGRLAERFGVTDSAPVRTPMAAGLKLSKYDMPELGSEEQLEMSKKPYRGIIGSGLYAALGSRPDIAYMICALSRFNQNPARSHWKHARRVIKYLNTTKSKGLNYSRKFLNSLSVTILSDSDWGSCEDDRRSVTGVVVKVAGGPVAWSSRKQKTVALSSCEAEFLALSEAVKEALWLRQILIELGINFDDPVTIYVDNQAAIALSKNAVQHQRSKHIDIRYFRVRDEVEQGRIAVIYVPTGENTADLLTKATNYQQWAGLIDELVFAVREHVLANRWVM